MSRKIIGKKYEENKRYIAYDYNMARNVDDDDSAYAIYDTQENDFYFDDLGNNPVFDTEEDAEKYIQDNKLNEDRELLVEDELGEDFYEKICRAYINTMNLEWVTTNPENNDSVVHGYFADDSIAEKYNYGKDVTPINFKDVAYAGFTDEEIESGSVDIYEYDTWEDFYEEYVKDEIDYDIEDIGMYDENDNWIFYISKDDLNKVGLLSNGIVDEDKTIAENGNEINYYKVTYRKANSTVSWHNICQAPDKSAVYDYYTKKYNVINISPASDSDIETAERKGIPFVEIN